jgi:hypothetical protein
VFSPRSRQFDNDVKSDRTRAGMKAADDRHRTLSKSRSGSRFEMALREGAARARLQVTLEANSPRFIRKLHDNVQLPWTTPRCVRTPPSIVVFESFSDVRTQADIETQRPDSRS